MTLPILVSVPHAGTRMPDEVKDLARISREDVIKDGDEQAEAIYVPLRGQVAHLVTTDIARAFVDVNRAPDDLRKDGVVKTHTCWNVPIYRQPPGEALIATLLDRYYHPYHRRLRELAHAGEVRVGIDCHTMVAFGPPVGPDPGSARPVACVSDAEGACDPRWTVELSIHLSRVLGGEVRINDPFKGGYITRSHAADMPWLQLEISRGDFATVEAKASAVSSALENWAEQIFDLTD